MIPGNSEFTPLKPKKPLPALVYLCKCSEGKRFWRHSPECLVWKQYKDSVIALVYLSPLKSEWNRLNYIFHVPSETYLDPPYNVNNWRGRIIEDRHPVYKAYQWHYGVYPNTLELGWFWRWSLVDDM